METPPPLPQHTPPPVNIIAPQKTGSGKKIWLFSGLILLVFGIGAAVYLVQTRQFFKIGAQDCALYNFNIDSQGNVTVTNNQSIPAYDQQATVSINGSPVTVLDVPEVLPGQTASLGQVTVPSSGGFTWTIIGSTFCSDSGSLTLPTPTPQATPTPTPVITTSPTPTLVITSTPTPTPVLTSTPTPTPILTSTPTPTSVSSPTPTPTSVSSPTPTPPRTSTPTPTTPPDNPPSPPNRCNGACTTDANCTYGEDGTKLICVNRFCRHPSCTDQISCHCPPAWPTTTPASQLVQSGAVTPTLTISLTGLLLIGLGILLAL